MTGLVSMVVLCASSPYLSYLLSAKPEVLSTGVEKSDRKRALSSAHRYAL